MLSFLYRLTMRYEREHGYRPNLIYLNSRHYQQLQNELAAINGLGELVRFLGMEIVLTEDVCHPNVAWTAVDWDEAVAV